VVVLISSQVLSEVSILGSAMEVRGLGVSPQTT
jgi:hypothetical protein